MSSTPENSTAKNTTQKSSTILCSYYNSSDRMVIVRGRGSGNYYLERVVFPFEVMTFHCPRECEVEIIMRTPTGLEQSEWVAAQELLAGEGSDELTNDWRPSQSLRTVSVGSSSSRICLNYS